jgi:hypothetical protein
LQTEFKNLIIPVGGIDSQLSGYELVDEIPVDKATKGCAPNGNLAAQRMK